jgi:hypothetical protein
MIGRAAARDLVHPRGEMTLIAVGVAVLEHPFEYDLGEILGGGALAGQFAEVAVKGAVMPLEELAEAVEVAIAHREHQGMIGGRRGQVHGAAVARVNAGGGGLHGKFGGDHRAGWAWSGRGAAGETGPRAKGYRKGRMGRGPLPG